jgi:hypothetical protein
MSELDAVRKAITDAIDLAKIGVEECEKKLADIERIKRELSRHHNDIARYEAALRALEGKVNAPAPAVTKGKVDGSLPVLPAGFWESLIFSEPMSPAEIYPMAVAKLGITPDAKQAQVLRGRMYAAVANLVRAGKIVQEGARGNIVYYKPSESTPAQSDPVAG